MVVPTVAKISVMSHAEFKSACKLAKITATGKIAVLSKRLITHYHPDSTATSSQALPGYATLSDMGLSQNTIDTLEQKTSKVPWISSC